MPLELTAADVRDRANLVPEKAKVFFYAAGKDIEVVAEWREGEQPMRRTLITLSGCLSIGGFCQ